LTVPSSSVGVYVADYGHRCCLCDEVIVPGTFVKQIGTGYATMPCVDKALSWMVEARERKRVHESKRNGVASRGDGVDGVDR
jgi:hypothetical protein